jgi:hypothetical protein
MGTCAEPVPGGAGSAPPDTGARSTVVLMLMVAATVAQVRCRTRINVNVNGFQSAALTGSGCPLLVPARGPCYSAPVSTQLLS